MSESKGKPQHITGIIGAGKVGLSLALLCQSNGHDVVVGCRDIKRTQAALGANAAKLNLNIDLLKIARESSTIILAVADTDIEAVSEYISPEVREHTTVTHLAGALDSQILKSARKSGAHIASTHPLNTFPHLESAITVLQNEQHNTALFCEGDQRALDILMPFFKSLGFNCQLLDAGNKILYHAACVMACNYSTAVIDASGKIARSAGLDEAVFIQALMPILRTTLNNIEQHGTLASLSGPIARGDVNNVAAHIKALQTSELNLTFANLYGALGLHATTMAEQNSRLDHKQIEALRDMLDLKN